MIYCVLNRRIEHAYYDAQSGSSDLSYCVSVSGSGVLTDPRMRRETYAIPSKPNKALANVDGSGTVVVGGKRVPQNVIDW